METHSGEIHVLSSCMVDEVWCLQRLIIFGLKQSSELACDPGMLGS